MVVLWCKIGINTKSKADVVRKNFKFAPVLLTLYLHNGSHTDVSSIKQENMIYEHQFIDTAILCVYVSFFYSLLM